MRVRLTNGPDGGVYLESSFREWEPVKDDFKATIPYDGRSWDATRRQWLIRALYVADLLMFLSQQSAHIQDDRQPVALADARTPMPDDLRDAFASLHLAPTAPLCVAEASYKALVKHYHPDRGGNADDFSVVSTAIKTVRFYLNPPEVLDDNIPF